MKDLSISEICNKILNAENLVVLTGAGISAESGVPTFRGKDGLWKRYRPEELATPHAFKRDPKTVWEWYDYRRRIIAPLNPNKAHKLLTYIEERVKNFVLITQNVDGLHEKAGTKNIIELHGNIWRVRCTSCNFKEKNTEVPLKEIPPKCPVCGSLLRPDVVWFGESLPHDALENAIYYSEKADVMLVIGTSAVVQPAASLPVIAKRSNAFVIEVNPEPTPITDIVDKSFRMKAVQFAEEMEKCL